MNEKYTDILKLKEKLIEECIPCELSIAFDGYVLKGIYGDVAQHQFTGGLEGYKFDSCDGDILENLSVDEAFELFANEYKKYGKRFK